MAEYINKAEVFEALCTCECDDKMECLDYVLISNLPTIDIVRCSECIHWEQSPTGEEGKCWRSPRHYSNHDDFCSHGAEPLHSERKE